MNVAGCFEGVPQRSGTVTALTDLHLELNAGQLSALLGSNGAGKTTAINLMLGLSQSTSGTVRALGADPHEVKARTAIGAMLQDINVPAGLSVQELVSL